jgi:hypothetical protein
VVTSTFVRLAILSRPGSSSTNTSICSIQTNKPGQTQHQTGPLYSTLEHHHPLHQVKIHELDYQDGHWDWATHQHPSIYHHLLMSSGVPTNPCGALIRAICFTLSLLLVLSYPSGQAVICLPLVLVPLSSPNPHLVSHWSGEDSALTDLSPNLKVIPHVWHTHSLNDTGSKYLWTLVNFNQSTWCYNPEDSHL